MSRPPASDAPDFDAMLCRFSDAMSIVATVAQALNILIEGVRPDPKYDLADNIYTLELGLSALRAVYNEYDVGIRHVRE